MVVKTIDKWIREKVLLNNHPEITYGEMVEIKFVLANKAPGTANCLICDTQISILRGISEVKKHISSKKHEDALREKRKNSVEIRKQLSVEDAFKNQSIHDKKQEFLKYKTSKAEVMITQAVDFHNIPDSFHDCLNSLLPIVFDDSAIARNYKCGTTKASYLLNHAIKDNCRIVTITGMQNNPFSL